MVMKMLSSDRSKVMHLLRALSNYASMSIDFAARIVEKVLGKRPSRDEVVQILKMLEQITSGAVRIHGDRVEVDYRRIASYLRQAETSLDIRRMLYEAYRRARAEMSLPWIPLIYVYEHARELGYRGSFREFIEAVERLSKSDPRIHFVWHPEYIDKPEKGTWIKID